MTAFRYLVVGRQPWNRRHFQAILASRAGHWTFCQTEAELSEYRPADFRYIFFLHWSSKVDEQTLSDAECVCFHMTDVPFGRGGSPLQNLIARGHRHTVLTALRMTEQFDAGPVYAKTPISLEGSTAEEILMRASIESCHMAAEIATEQPVPKPQSGEAVVFRRRLPSESRLPGDLNDLTAVFDHIRMLDADGYPPAFLEFGNLRIEFTRAALYDGEVRSDVRITMQEQLPDDANGTKRHA